MAKVTNIQKARQRKKEQGQEASRPAGFIPCSPDMTICGDCVDNRSKNKCPRLKEWLTKHREEANCFPPKGTV